jgi:pimeloyl-ACP methyl ester carboxylesterase
MQTRKGLGKKEKTMGIINQDYKAYIIHGWAYSLEKYKKISELLESKGLDNVILKVPGLTEKIDKPWDIKDYIDWVKNKIDQEKSKVILIGHSNGGRIAAAYASKFPKKLQHLILIDSAGIYHDEIHTKIKLVFFATLAKIGKRISSSSILRNMLYKLTRENDYNHATEDMKKTMVNLIKSDLTFYLSRIITPTLIIWGEKDKVTPLNDGKIMHKLIKNSKLYIVNGARHSPHFTHAEEVADVIFKTAGI